MDIEEELLSFLDNPPRKVGQPKLDGSPRKMAAPNPELHARNKEVILAYFGFGSEQEFWPTYEELGERHGGLTRERIRQLIAKNLTDHLVSPLPVAKAVAAVLEKRDFWAESEFLAAVSDEQLTGELQVVIGLVHYLQAQGLAKEYVVCLPTMIEVTKGSYFEHEDRVIVTRAKQNTLAKDLAAARKLPGLAGLANIRHVARPRATIDVERLQQLIKMRSDGWSAIHGDQFWYMFEDYKDNCLVNAAEKTFAIVDQVPLHALSEMLHHSLFRRSTKTEYPSRELIGLWISQSGHFTVEGDIVTFNGTSSPLVDIEKELVKQTKGRGVISTAVVRKGLVSSGFSEPNADKVAFGSPLLFMDKSEGRGKYKVTLATDLRKVGKPAGGFDRYQQFKERLAAVGKTDRASSGTMRREQTLLALWIFGKNKHGECAICQKVYSRRALVVAHKKKRRDCTDGERLDPHIAFPLCIFGCDFLYEHGFLRVRAGKVTAGNATLSDTEQKSVTALVGKSLKEPWSHGPEKYFDNG